MRVEISYFNKRSAAYRAEYDKVTPEGFSFRMRRDKVLEMVPDGSKVIDIASGPGIIVAGLLQKKCAVTCVDAAPEMIARTKEEFPTVDAQVADAYALPFPDKSFDIALALGLIEYLEKQEVFLKDVSRILKPGGTFIVTFPNYTSPWRAFNRIALAARGLFKKPRPISDDNVIHREYTLGETRALLESNGYTVMRVRYYNFKLIPFPFDRWFPRFTVAQSRIFEHLDTSIFRWLGTGFIVEAKKRS